MRSIDPILLSKIKEQNQTIWNNAQPKMSVTVARAKSSVRDSTYFTIEKIREKEGITDVAVSARRMKPIGPPDRIYGIHIDNGIAKTSLREYPDKLKEHWKYQFDVGEASAVSIVFDGRWYMNYKKKWGLQTDELPWIFWVDLTGKLYARIWETGTTYELATDVVKLDTVRGWIPAQAGHTDDQGIVVAYIKSDGKVYYRNYCLQETGLIIWETEKEMTAFGTGCVGVRMFRTNDFRVGFIAEKETGNIIAITRRNWAGMSIPPENISARISAEINFIPLEFEYKDGCKEHVSADIDVDMCYCPVDKLEVVPLGIERTSITELAIRFNTDLFNVNNAEVFEVTNDDKTMTYNVSGVTFDNESKILKLITNEISSMENILVTYTGGLNNILVVNNDMCKLELDSFVIADEVSIPVQDGYIEEHITANLAVTMLLNKMVKTPVYEIEHIEANLIVTIAFWDVDDAPI